MGGSLESGNQGGNQLKSGKRISGRKSSSMHSLMKEGLGRERMHKLIGSNLRFFEITTVLPACTNEGSRVRGS